MAADSLVNLKKMTKGDISCALGRGDRFERVLALCAWAESGTESLTRLRLQRHGVLLQTQVQIGQIGRVDLLVGERLIIEVDSRAHHTGEENYRKDRERDLQLRALGYIVVRLTYEQVMYRWDEVEPLILAMIRRGDQWWASRRRRLVA
ncbi:MULTISPECIES: endonuclease domain-containing protein [unclassified Luteococcus]|uniref:endonuclease domain-containing protein n=1 Tax=unclassified Luteococcus TaxID=2639923 RepID=UPI00313B4ACB